MYRKSYLIAAIFFVISLIFSNLGSGGIILSIATLIVSGICGKFLVCKRFVEFLDLKSDEVLVLNGGVNGWVVYVFAAINIIMIALIIFFIGVISYS